MLKQFLSDRRLWALGLLCGLALVLARLTLPQSLVFGLVVKGGYWVMLGLVSLWVCSLWRPIRSWRQALGLGGFEARILAAILVLSMIWVANERPGYKVLADELLLLGTSMGMHYEREAVYPTRATDVQGSFRIMSGTLDKRPLLFPFLVAITHDVTGYRPENAFYLNIFLGAVFLGLCYGLGRKIGGTRAAGVLALMLFGGLPLLAQQATGGGFELLNLALLETVILLMVRYLEDVSERRQEALVWAALMLACTRYESALFLLPVAGAVLLGWWRSGRVIFSWPLFFTPVVGFLALAQNRIFSENTNLWETKSVPGATEPFGIQYLSSNLGHALAFFFDTDGYQPNSLFFAALGLLCLPFFWLWLIRSLRTLRRLEAWAQTATLMGLGLMAVSALYLLYFWGQFDEPIIRRLSLPVHLLFLLAILVSVRYFIKHPQAWTGLGALALFGFLVQGLPTLAKQAYRTIYPPGLEMDFRTDFLAKYPERNLLFIDNDAFFWITRHISAAPVEQAKLRKDSLIYHLRNRSFDGIYVFQSYLVNQDTGVASIDAVDDLGPDFELETIWERRIQTLLLARISRVKAISEGGVVAAEARPFITPLKETRSVEQLNASRSIYMENWIKQLP